MSFNMNKKPYSRIFLFIALIIFAIFFINVESRASGGTVEASFINVGEGDLILLRDGNGFDVLIDGGKPEAGLQVAAALAIADSSPPGTFESN